MVPCAAGKSDAGAIEYVDGCFWEDGDDSANGRAGCAFVCHLLPFASVSLSKAGPPFSAGLLTSVKMLCTLTEC